MIPINLLQGKASADFINTGEWAKKAIKEAKPFCQANVIASSEDKNFSYAPAQSDWKLNKDAAYVHYTANETIGGVEFHWVPDTGDVPLVCDMSSNILSKPVDEAKYGLIYAGAQKNIGPAGLTIVIVRDDLIGKGVPTPPTMLDYKTHADNDSMFNTPPTYGIYIAGLVFQWLKKRGGLAVVEKKNIEKAKLLYDYLDQSSFFKNPVRKEDRSRMNVAFTLRNESLDDEFIKGAKERGMIQLKGHRSVGGMRASIYNAMPIAGIQMLVQYMREFEAKHG
jgi:phosphoserine aminotransferase